SCIDDASTGYDNYLKSLGLYEMGDRHSELRRVRDSKEVYLYDALPSATSKYTQKLGNRPLLVQAYVDNTHGFLLGWETYYAITNTSNLFRTEYWYGDMLDQTPSVDVFKDLPSICEPTV
ncbi:Protein C18E9.5, partial [Aphelenchoides avenae]